MTTAGHRKPQRNIGAIGTAVRVLLGLTGLALAVADRPFGLFYGIQLHDLVLGFGVFPAVMVAIGLLARQLGVGRLRWAGPVGILINLGVLVVLYSVPYTSGAALLFYGASLLIAAARGTSDCEATVVSNLILHRDDQIGCPVLTPIDAAEARRHRAGVEITLLSVPNCPNTELARQRVIEALDGNPASIHQVIVADDREATKHGMTGSPTILINGTNPFTPADVPPSMSCSIQSPPSVDDIRQAVAFTPSRARSMGDRSRPVTRPR